MLWVTECDIVSMSCSICDTVVVVGQIDWLKKACKQGNVYIKTTKVYATMCKQSN